MKDPFTLYHEWATKPLDSPLTIPSDIHHVVTELLSPEDRLDREKVNAAVGYCPGQHPAVEVYRRGQS